jgi:hypothetical protein
MPREAVDRGYDEATASPAADSLPLHLLQLVVEFKPDIRMMENLETWVSFFTCVSGRESEFRGRERKWVRI